MFDIYEELKKLPDKPGVYLMKDIDGSIIYVGKAINLKKRVRQYFQSSKNKDLKVISMVKKISEFEYIITDNELEALILEANLIKKHKPKYNILLRDDKQYPYIKITLNEKFPRILKVRQVKKDKSKYFGPYTSTGAVNDTIDIIRKLYPLRTCNLNLEGKPKDRPCLNYHIGRCLGPCFKKIDEKNYMNMVNEIILFLNGKEDKLIELMENKMKEAAKCLDFEKAARYRDKINSLKHMLEKQKIVSVNRENQDVIAFAKGIDEAVVVVFFIRDGKILGREHYIITNVMEKTRDEIISSFIKQFYLGASFVPKEILVEEDFSDRQVVMKWLSEKTKTKINIKVPKRGEKNKLIDMVRLNALELLKKNSDRFKRNLDENIMALEELSNLLNLGILPNRIEAYDISNIQGVESVGSMVVFEKGIKKSRDYRRFKIKSILGPNDYGSMEEIIKRRFIRGLEERELIKKNDIKIESFSIFPDLIMIDGGKGQVNSALKVLNELNISIPVCGLVKDDFHRTRGIIYNNKEINLKDNSKAFKLITRIQDEAHRFAINYHRSLRKKKVFKSILDEIPGIGEKRKKTLLKEIGSIEKIREASIEDLKNVEGMNIKAAENVYNFFRKKK